MDCYSKVMVKKRYFVLLFIFLLIICHLLIMYRSYSSVYTYYFKEMDFRFQVIEKDTCDVLVLGDSDSIFFSHPLNGNYLGIEFFLSVDSSIIYLGPYFPIIYNQVERKYVTKKITRSFEDTDNYEPYKNEKYWGFYGECDQGKYTFGIMRNKRFYRSLEPLEWKTR